MKKKIALLILAIGMILPGCKKETETTVLSNSTFTQTFTINPSAWQGSGTNGQPGYSESVILNWDMLTQEVVDNGLVKVEFAGTHNVSLPYISGSGTITHYTYTVGSVTVFKVNYSSWYIAPVPIDEVVKISFVR